ncbi:hypothetical protein ACFV9D_00250 [Streptomyces sp. NPDC059875]|uniref:hypothetical protein n=1 Tax=unclassified Streptomyces TaxID=2593676 RepID=UPI003659192D
MGSVHAIGLWPRAESGGRSRCPYRFEDRPALPCLLLRQPVRALRRLAERPHVLVAGVYGAVLASSLVAALSE